MTREAGATEPRLAEFQRAAVDRIVRRLTAPSGARRFLLADEVGLGKTLVARGVITKLARRLRRPLVVVYLCSNAEIAEQNRTKLDPTAGRRVRRVSELALRETAASGRVHLYAFTPGTSLREGTGLEWERRLVLFLLDRVLGKDVTRPRWREFFRCSVGEDVWYERTRTAQLDEDFSRKTSLGFQERLAEEWRRAVRLDGAAFVPARDLDDEVERFAAGAGSDEGRRRRSHVVALLRRGVQQVALAHLEPDLVILDEVQRFRDVLKEADRPQSIASQLFRRPTVAALILSATPYRMLTLDHEEEEHYKDLRITLGFLRGRSERNGPDPILRDLERFRQRLQEGHFLAGPDLELRALKETLERSLGEVMCRTERNWYMEDARKGVDEVLSPGVPGGAELADFVRFRRALVRGSDSTHHITEYWKSGPAPLTFMDVKYAVAQWARKEGRCVPASLVADPTRDPGLATRHHRMRSLLERVLGGHRDNRWPRWRYLWVRPTYLYYRDEFYGSQEPTKFLVFSGWRFVPKAISVVASAAVSRSLGGEAPFDGLTPLRFAEKRSFHVFDACFPSPALAAVVDVAALAAVREHSAEELEREAVHALEMRLRDRRVSVGDVGNDPIWRLVARLESPDLVTSLRNEKHAASDEDASQHYSRHRKRFSRWLLDEDTPLRASRARLRRIARIATWSPAVSLLRALWSVYPETRGTLPPGVLTACLGSLRHYLNRPVVQAVLAKARAGPGGRYTERVLRYCRDAQVQAMLDEFLYLLRDVGGKTRPDKAVAHVARVLATGVGLPKVSVARPSGSGRVAIVPEPRPHRAHFALAFGEETGDDQAGPGEEAAERRTAVREAFNSPFWPFVLATTSVGQEGLDFHFYCRDVVHWNLPANPVDLEQREGRINRRDGLGLRRMIARDWPLTRLRQHSASHDANLWRRVFATLERVGGSQRYKHGLYPHWVYESGPDGTKNDDCLIRRHLIFHVGSRDVGRYEVLKDGLALYRLVFGQPRQEDLLAWLHDRLGQTDVADRSSLVRAHLAYYMVNLSPFSQGYAMELAQHEARTWLDEPDHVKMEEMRAQMSADVRRLLAARPAELGPVRSQVDDLLRIVEAFPGEPMRRRDVQRALEVLLYLRNPYDRYFDVLPGIGLADDVELLRRAHRTIFRGAP